MSPDCIYLQTVVTFEIGKEKKEIFTCTGKTLVSAGYTGVMTWQAIAADESVPQFKKGDICDLNDVSQILYLLNKASVSHKPWKKAAHQPHWDKITHLLSHLSLVKI